MHTISSSAHASCCGITSWNNFGGIGEEDTGERCDCNDRNCRMTKRIPCAAPPTKDNLAKFKEEAKNIKNERQVFEIVLNDMQAEGWQPYLLAEGFRRVVRFLNGNSGNFCTIYHYYGGKKGEEYQVFDPD